MTLTVLRLFVLASAPDEGGYDAFPVRVLCHLPVVNDEHRGAALSLIARSSVSKQHPMLVIDADDPVFKTLEAGMYSWDTTTMVDVDGRIIEDAIAARYEAAAANNQPLAGQLAVTTVTTDPEKGPEMTAQPAPVEEPAPVKQPEQILTFPTKHWHAFFHLAPEGRQLTPLVEIEQDTLLSDFASSLVANDLLPDDFEFKFQERGDAIENNRDFLQPIPYIIFLSGSKGVEEIFTYQRAKGQGEKRLLKKFSVGVGGHCNPSEGHLNPYREAISREIREELGQVGVDVFDLHGRNTGKRVPAPEAFIYDTTEPVNAVHLGGVHIVRCSGRPEFECEASMANCDWEPLMRAFNRLSDFESWSQTVIKWLIERR